MEKGREQPKGKYLFNLLFIMSLSYLLVIRSGKNKTLASLFHWSSSSCNPDTLKTQTHDAISFSCLPFILTFTFSNGFSNVSFGYLIRLTQVFMFLIILGKYCLEKRSLKEIGISCKEKPSLRCSVFNKRK